MDRFERAYQIDGGVSGCLSASCPNSCCGPKRTWDAAGEEVPFRTTLLGDGELEYQRRLDAADPQLAALGVEIFTLGGPEGDAHFVDGCLGEDGCKLEPIGRKPIVCRAHPLGPKYKSTSCPALEAIAAQNSGVMDALREALGTNEI